MSAREQATGDERRVERGGARHPSPVTPAYDLAALRAAEFPWAAAGESVYLNNASTGPLPERTVAAVGEFTRLRAAPFRLGVDLQFATVARSRRGSRAAG